jgi:hypothetical protein
MTIAQRREALRLPETLEAQLHGFRRRVWAIKMAEAAGAAVFAVIAAFLGIFVLDRLWDTPRWLRLAVWAAALGGCAIVPLYLHRWVWRARRLEQLARLLIAKLPRLGDQLLGIIELVHSEGEQARSRALCEAAVRSVAHDAQKCNLRAAAPNSRHRGWGLLAATVVAAAVALAVLFPAAAANAWRRFLAPWAAAPRYTFAALESLPAEIVVPHGEPFALAVRLRPGSLWQPHQGRVQLEVQRPVLALLQDGTYRFELPGQIAEGRLRVSIGDARQTVRIKPMLRPELTSVVAEVTLPAYLGQPRPVAKDVRGGTVALVKGSRARFAATASRKLAAASVDGREQTPTAAVIQTSLVDVAGERKIEFRWHDEFALAGKEPFTLTVTACDDEAPSLSCEDLPRSRVVLDSEQLNFRVKAEDDFGVKEIGLQWQGADRVALSPPAKGERLLAAGGYDRRTLEAAGTFSAQSLGIEPQLIHLRVFTVDYFPGRERVYSPAYVLYVLNAEQHAVWITEQLNKWHRLALEVRDREMQLHETNKQLRGLPPEELDRPDARRRIENQAAAERANGARLKGLTAAGQDLLRQAARNPQFDVGSLDRWAEMLRILKDIAGNRMPSVADLLNEAARARAAAAAAGRGGPKAGQTRAAGGRPSGESAGKQPPPPVPKIADRESSLQPADKNARSEASRKKPSSPSFRLPTTTLMGQSSGKPPPQSPAGEKMEEAVHRQQDLLAEFEKIVNELNNVLAHLEGSTLVKRLKAASREQYRVAGRVGDLLEGAFGARNDRIAASHKSTFADLSAAETKSCQNVSIIMDDIQAYFERRRFVKFKTVLDEMRSQDVIGGLRQVADDLSGEPGLSIAQCEYWWDTLDRWAEDLVDPACEGTCQCSGSGSLPPAIVLEVLKILEGEVNLREETRVAEQARPAVDPKQHRKRALGLARTQDGLQERVKKVAQQIRALPHGEEEFPREIKLLEVVAEVMGETSAILVRPETGPPAIGAETDVIELLLQSRRINPRGGGGGGATPGGGGGGTTSDSALALLGIGVNEKEVREHATPAQAVGVSGRSLPEEFRAGLDEYFSRFERRDSQ